MRANVRRIYVEPQARPPIVCDGKHPDFFAALIGRDNREMPGLAELAYWRNYITSTAPFRDAENRNRIFRSIP